MTILGISIGTVRTGVCLIRDGELLDGEFRVHRFSSQLSEKKLRAIPKTYRQYLRKYPVQAIMVKIPPLKRHTKATGRIIKGIEALAKEYQCKFDLITKSELKHVTSLRSTDEIIDFTRRLYPELAPIYEKGLPNGHAHYRKLYEAVLSAHVYHDWHRRREQRADSSPTTE
jgi:hypothetical protein